MSPRDLANCCSVSNQFLQKNTPALILKGTDVYRTIINRRLVYDFNLKAFKSAKKPRLTPAMKAKRLAFAKQYENWDEVRWNKVLFSDKSTIPQFALKKWTVCRPVGTRFNDCYTQATVKHRPCVIIWGGVSSIAQLVQFFSSVFVVFFLPIGTTVNSVRYRKCWRICSKFV